MSQEAADRGKGYSRRLVEKAVAAGRTTKGDGEALLARITATADPQDAAGADLVVEAVFEDPSVKAAVYAEIEPVAPWLGTTAPTLDPAGYTLTTGGRATLHRLGVTAPDDPVVVCCVDWTEQRHHLGGPLGRALLDRFLQLGWLQPSRRSRAVHLTQDGIRGLRAELGAELPNPSPADPARAAPTA